MAAHVNFMGLLQPFVLITWEVMLLGDLKKDQLPTEDAVIVWQHLMKLKQRFGAMKYDKMSIKD